MRARAPPSGRTQTRSWGESTLPSRERHHRRPARGGERARSSGPSRRARGEQREVGAAGAGGVMGQRSFAGRVLSAFDRSRRRRRRPDRRGRRSPARTTAGESRSARAGRGGTPARPEGVQPTAPPRRRTTRIAPRKRRRGLERRPALAAGHQPRQRHRGHHEREALPATRRRAPRGRHAAGRAQRRSAASVSTTGTRSKCVRIIAPVSSGAAGGEHRARSVAARAPAPAAAQQPPWPRRARR